MKSGIFNLILLVCKQGQDAVKLIQMELLLLSVEHKTVKVTLQTPVLIFLCKYIAIS
jgi:hypothetical protein